MGYIDVQNLAPRIRGDVLMGITLMDNICPPSTQFAAFNKITSKKEAMIYPDFGHEGIPGFSDHTFEFMMGAEGLRRSQIACFLFIKMYPDAVGPDRVGSYSAWRKQAEASSGDEWKPENFIHVQERRIAEWPVSFLIRPQRNTSTIPEFLAPGAPAWTSQVQNSVR